MIVGALGAGFIFEMVPRYLAALSHVIQRLILHGETLEAEATSEEVQLN